jgi:hypothetical protein
MVSTQQPLAGARRRAACTSATQHTAACLPPACLPARRTAQGSGGPHLAHAVVAPGGPAEGLSLGHLPLQVQLLQAGQAGRWASGSIKAPCLCGLRRRRGQSAQQRPAQLAAPTRTRILLNTAFSSLPMRLSSASTGAVNSTSAATLRSSTAATCSSGSGSSRPFCAGVRLPA